jgi:hypothetical protein
LLALGGVALAELVQFWLALRETEYLFSIVNEFAIASHINSASSLAWFFTRLILESIVGLMLFGAALLLIIGKYPHGIYLANIALLLSLTVVNLLVFYFDQFSTIILASLQFLTLLGVIRYRKKFIIR